jgi:hypothetical protein
MPHLSYFKRLNPPQYDTFFGPPTAVEVRTAHLELPSQKVLGALASALSGFGAFSSDDRIAISRIVGRLSEIEATIDQRTALRQVSELAKLLKNQAPQLK